MELNIAKLGKQDGTVGWLRTGLENGSIKFEETETKSGRHALVIRYYEKACDLLAVYNEFGLSPTEARNAGCDVKYALYTAQGFDSDRGEIWTDAAWSKIMEAAQAWCNERNAERDADGQADEDLNFEIKLLRVG